MRWPVASFAVAFLLLGLAYWQMPYNQPNPSYIALLPGAVALGVLTALLVAARVVPAQTAAMTMLACAPAVDLVAILKDVAVDPTSHNLAPLELAMIALAGARFVVPGLLAGVLGRALIRR